MNKKTYELLFGGLSPEQKLLLAVELTRGTINEINSFVPNKVINMCSEIRVGEDFDEEKFKEIVEGICVSEVKYL